MPRGKKELAEQIIPKLREVEVEVGRGKTVLEAVCADARKPPPQGVRGVSRNRLRTPGPAPPETHESLISRKTVAEVPLTGLSFGGLKGVEHAQFELEVVEQVVEFVRRHRLDPTCQVGLHTDHLPGCVHRLHGEPFVKLKHGPPPAVAGE